jgi:hypothetical protein
MVVLVDLNWRQLSLVDNVLVGKGADIEPVLNPDRMRGPLPQDIELPLKEPLIKFLQVCRLGSITRAVCRMQNDKGLQDDGLSRGSRRTKERRVCRGLSPTQDPEAQRLGNIFQLPLRLVQRLLVGLEEKIPHRILARRWKLNSLFALKVLDKELVGDRGHDTRTVTISRIRSHRTAMGHVAQEVSRCGQSAFRPFSLEIQSLPSLTILWLGLPLMWLRDVSVKLELR